MTAILAALADRCEAATVGDRELDRLIAEAVGFRGRHTLARGYTLSMDAAVTLVPEGWGWSVKAKMDGAEFAVSVWRYLTGRGPSVYAATPALALCAAALRARAAA